MADPDLYSLLTGGGTPDPQAQASAVAAQLRRRRSFGELGALSGDPVLQPFGAEQMKSADVGAEEVARNRLSEAQQAQQQDYQTRSLAQSGAYQTGELAHGQSALAETIREHNLQHQEKAWEYGIGAGGGKDPQFEGVVDKIGNYQMAPINVSATRNPRNIALMERVVEKYPGFDANQYNVAKKAEAAFGAGGLEGRTVRAANTAVQHLGVLDDAIDKLGNNDIPAWNAVRQGFTKAFGVQLDTSKDPFNATKSVVVKELDKFLTASGHGGVDERKSMYDEVNAANSPTVLRQVVSRWKELMSGQMKSLKMQYDSDTRRSDFVKRYVSPETSKALGWDQPGSGADGASAAGWKITPVN